MARKIKAGGAKPPVYTGKGRKGIGLGYHGHPNGATRPAKGLGYHGVGPKSIRASKRGPGKMPKAPMVIPHSKPASHKAGSTRRVGGR
jgi:hypothetical protein